MPGLRRHTSCLFVWGCGLQLSEPCGLSWFSARGVRPWYRACTIPFQNTHTTLARSYNNDNLVWYVGKRLWYGTHLSTTFVRLIITNQTSDHIGYTSWYQLLVYSCISCILSMHMFMLLLFSCLVTMLFIYLPSAVILVIILCTLFICTSFPLFTHTHQVTF